MFFQTETAASLSGYFETNIWGQVVLQLCHREQFARHAVVALAALNKTIEAMSNSSGIDRDSGSRLAAGKRHHAFALKEYGKALRLMRENTADADDEHHLRNALISCLLTTCFECYHGDQEAALAAGESGVKLLSSFQEKRALLDTYSMKPFTGSAVIDPELIAAFARLESSVLMFVDSLVTHRRISLQIAMDTSILNDMPSEFQSLREARRHWDILTRRAMHWRATYSGEEPDLPSDTADGAPNSTLGIMTLVNGEVVEKLNAQVGMHLETVSRWLNAFDPVYRKCRALPKHNSDYTGATNLRLKYLSSCFALPSTCNISENLMSCAIEVVAIARELLGLHRDPAKKCDKTQATFTFDDSVVIGLFLVATRCRNRAIRREAIMLLYKNPRREALWDSEMAAKVAEWFVETEEQGLRDEDEIVPDSRMVIISNDFILSERTAVVRCLKTAVGEDVLLPLVKLKW